MYLAGHHNAFYSINQSSGGSASFFCIGSTRNGIDKVTTHHDDPVVDDAFGMATPDSINQGTDIILSLDWIEYDTIVQALQIQNSSLAQPLVPASMGLTNINVGHTLTTLAGTLVLVPVVGTPAATQLGVGKCRVYPTALVVSDFRILFASKQRQGACTFRCFPGVIGGIAQAEFISTTSSYSNTNGTNPAGATTLTPYFSGF